MRARSRKPTGLRVSNRVQQDARLFCGEHGRLAFLYGMLRAANHARGVGRHDLTDDKPVEEHSDGGKLKLDGRGGDTGL